MAMIPPNTAVPAAIPPSVAIVAPTPNHVNVAFVAALPDIDAMVVPIEAVPKVETNIQAPSAEITLAEIP
ncbi:hypothetical protein NSQ61_05395 [Aeribacillus sp. FSL K6-1121]|jgi:hypothetical protein|uniref:hypothetical protein n=1 Tax=Aeribacillus sp. FSL K6-1121 TaxID=2954745 RepID=UPI0030F75E2E